MKVNEQMKTDGLHQEQYMLHYGSVLDDADAAMIMLHGRGSSAHDIISLAYEIDLPNIAYFAPHAKNNSWYPMSFLSPIKMNEPHLSSSLTELDSAVEMIGQKGIPSERIFFLGFSQGACLSLEYAVRNPQKYGGIFGLSGGLIGDSINQDNYTGNFDGTEVFLGCSDVDPHIPLQRVNQTEDVFKKLNAKVTKRIYKGMGHTINDSEMAFIRSSLKESVGKQ